MADAHPGLTDSNDGHYCKTNCEKWGLSYGEYHYHNGSSSSSSTPKSSTTTPAKPALVTASVYNGGANKRDVYGTILHSDKNFLYTS
ncbi:YHYH domain-containing protein [Peribacillus loiseleuriae]|uniref:YHYH domain-containing protein n=1 Tax=Peribacillus loiseleuriae TaxID=1679170 RepID=UPI003D078C84